VTGVASSEIFISYASEDRPRAQQLADVLRARGWSVWWDREIDPGRAFADVIEEALDSAKVVIVLWSASALASRWVRAEADAARERNVLVPVLLEEGLKLPILHRGIQAAQLWDWRGGSEQHDGLRRLLQWAARTLDEPMGKPIQAPAVQPRQSFPWMAVAALALGGSGVAFLLWMMLRPEQPSEAPPVVNNPVDALTAAAAPDARREIVEAPIEKEEPRPPPAPPRVPACIEGKRAPRDGRPRVTFDVEPAVDMMSAIVGGTAPLALPISCVRGRRVRVVVRSRHYQDESFWFEARADEIRPVKWRPRSMSPGGAR
jgi:hypothetical protein